MTLINSWVSTRTNDQISFSFGMHCFTTTMLMILLVRLILNKMPKFDNSLHPNINFTFEKQKKIKLSSMSCKY